MKKISIFSLAIKHKKATLNEKELVRGTPSLCFNGVLYFRVNILDILSGSLIKMNSWSFMFVTVQHCILFFCKLFTATAVEFEYLFTSSVIQNIAKPGSKNKLYNKNS